MMSALVTRKLLRWTLWLGLAATALAVAALALAPMLVDVPAIRARLERKLSDATGGQVVWDDLQIRLLPSPSARVHNARLEIPDRVSGRIEAAEISLELLPLLQGRVELQRVRLLHAVVHVTPPPATESAPREPVAPLIAYRDAVQPVADAMRRFAPDVVVVLEDADVAVRGPVTSILRQIRLNAEARSDANGLTLTGQATGTLWDQMRLHAHLDYADLKAHAEIEGKGFKPQPLIDHFLSGAQIGVTLPLGSFRLVFDTDGRTTLKASALSDIPALTMTRGNVSAELKPVHVEAQATSRGEAVDVTLGVVRMGDLAPSASGSLSYFLGDRQPARAQLEVPTLDLQRLRHLATTLLPDQPVVQRYVRRVHGGKVTNVRVTAQAARLAALADPGAIQASLDIEQGAMLAPYLEQDVTDVSGSLAWKDGVLEVRHANLRLAGGRLSDGSLRYAVDAGDTQMAVGYDLDLAQTLELTRRLLPDAQRAALDALRSARGRAQGRVDLAFGAKSWQTDVAVLRSDAVFVLRDVPWPLFLRKGQAAVSNGRVSVAGADGALGASTFRALGAELSTAGPLRVHAARGEMSVALPEVYEWIRTQRELADKLGPVRGVTGTVDVAIQRFEGRLDRPDALDYEATLHPREVSVQIDGLPDRVALSGGTVKVTPPTVRAEGVLARMLDAQARVTVAIAGLQKPPLQVEAAASEGTAGERTITWAWQRADAPQRLVPRPLERFDLRRLRWSAAGGIDVQASLQFAGGPTVAVDAAAGTDDLQVRTLHVKDRLSDATMALRLREKLVDVSFDGVLAGRSVADMLAHTSGEYPGRLEGQFRAAIDRDLRGRSVASGRLQGRVLRLDELIGRPIVVERIDLEADGSLLTLREATLEYDGQKASIRGFVRKEGTVPLIEAEVETPGLVIDAFLPPAQTDRPGGQAPPATAPEQDIERTVWPLPVRGRVALRAGFLEYAGRRVEPVRASLTLEPERARMDVAEAMLCGVAFPFSVEVTQRGIEAAARVAATGQQVEATSRCLTHESLLLTGAFDLRTDLRTQGRREQLASNLEGTIEARARNGKVMKFGLLGNILSLKSVTSVLKGKVSLGADGFDYRSMAVRGRISKGVLQIDEGAFDSPALGLAATGTVNLKDENAKMTVLVAPFTRVDQIVRKIPIIGYILGGTLTSVAVSVTGNIRDPTVVPLDPRAITSELVGIFERTLKLPRKLIEPLQPKAPAAQGAR
jgi:hypothetical protein